MDAGDLQGEYDQLRKEVRSYSEDLARTPHCVVVTKTDLLPPESHQPELVLPDAWGVFFISAVARMGLDLLLESLYAQTRQEMEKEEGTEEEEWWVPE